jgi:hypothetical protein
MEIAAGFLFLLIICLSFFLGWRTRENMLLTGNLFLRPDNAEELLGRHKECS